MLIGGIGAVGGYFAASFLSELLQPVYSWRIMWFLNLPTGLLLVAMSPLLPESARHAGALRRRGPQGNGRRRGGGRGSFPPVPPVQGRFLGLTAALTLGALTWSLVNFGLLLWLPATQVEEGLSVAAASGLIAKSTLISIPVVAVATWFYARWSSKWSLVLMMGMMATGLMLFLLRNAGDDPLFALTFVIVGSSGVISILLPYTAENYPLRVRGRATGWVAGCSKLGSLAVQGLSVAGAVPTFGVAAALIALPILGGLLLVAWPGRKTMGRDLRDLERASGA